ncbi:calretinin-like isoform X2 [Amphiura filiformis]|uniref:calretinin-like isoform X2 n=1 Tax=Amphiura filiformis TaxID=82378 RepID=UPI003B228239
MSSLFHKVGSGSRKGRRKSSYDNFLEKYPSTNKLTADAFAKIWGNYDTNGSGFIDEEGLDKFFKDLLQTMTKDEINPEMEKDLRDCMMSAYDRAGDGRIAMSELAEILPTDENFIMVFRSMEEHKLDSVEFMEMWKKYDKDKSGYINAKELKRFIRDVLKAAGNHTIRTEKLDEYVQAIVSILDKDGNGKLGMKEMSRLLSVSQSNVLTQFEAKFEGMSLRDKVKHFNDTFNYYDKSRTGYLDGSELDAFIKDLMEPDVDDLSAVQIDAFKKQIVLMCDSNDDGRIDKEDFKLILNLHTDVELL